MPYSCRLTCRDGIVRVFAIQCLDMPLPVKTWNHDPLTIQRALDVLKKRGVSNACPRCLAKRWLTEIVALHVSELPEGDFPFLTTGSYVPSLSLTCENCGCVFMHNLINLGVIS